VNVNTVGLGKRPGSLEDWFCDGRMAGEPFCCCGWP
jgi:hypothetical protein